MFDLEVFIGPAIVLLGMFIGLLGFAIWGTRAIRESVPLLAQAQSVAPLVDGADLEAAEPLSELALPDIEGNPFGPPKEAAETAANVDGVNLEKTAEFEQPLTSVNTVASFSQSFWEGQEVSTAPAAAQSDYNEAIDRIQAGLNAADAEEFNKDAGDADAMAAANVLEALRHGVVAAKADGANSELAPEDAPPESADLTAAESTDISPETADSEDGNSAAPAEDVDNEATRLISDEETAAILAADSENKDKTAEKEPGEETEEEIREIAHRVAAELAEEDNEATRVLKLQPETSPAENELAGNMEETVVMQKLAEEEPQPAPNLQRIPPGVAVRPSSFGFVTNQANGMASARSLPDLSNLTQEEAGDTLLPETPIPFGPKMAWLAIPGFKPSEVITALRLDDVQTANWTKGLQEAYADNNQVFVSPSLGGWVLVIGKTLWERADMNRSAENIGWLKEICRKFGNACFFSTMRGLGNHGWVGIRDGQIFRAYGYSGELQELIWLVGEPTEEEIAINPGFITEVREKYQPGFRPIIPDEKLVLSVAAAWSVDPGFRRRQYPADFGMIGYMN